MSQHRTAAAIVITIIVLVGFGLTAWWMIQREQAHSDHDHDDHGHETQMDDIPRGPHHGRLLTQGDFAVELTVFETGVPPEFRVYPYLNGAAIEPDQVSLNIELGRLDGQIDRFEFKPQQDFLRGMGVVTEPHSFDVTVSANYQGKTYQWQFENYEGRTDIANEMAKQAGIETEKAGSAVIEETLILNGRILIDPDRLSHVRARYPGVVKNISRKLGDAVSAGDVLASIQSNESLQTYVLRAPIAGVIVQRNIQIGEATGQDPLFIITDLSRVWAEFDIFSQDLDRVRQGQRIAVETLDGHTLAGQIEWISPLAAHTSQSVRARVSLINKDGLLRAGQFVRGHVTIANHQVDLAVRQSGIQSFRDFQVVYARIGDTYEVRMLELGRSNADWVEVLGGLKPGTEYVIENSYLIKADIEKSGASHDH